MLESDHFFCEKRISVVLHIQSILCKANFFTWVELEEGHKLSCCPYETLLRGLKIVYSKRLRLNFTFENKVHCIRDKDYIDP